MFTWFVNLVSTFGAITWMCICYTHVRFMKALQAQGMSRDDLPYKAPFQPWGSWFALVSTAIITIFKGMPCCLVNRPIVSYWHRRLRYLHSIHERYLRHLVHRPSHIRPLLRGV